MKARLISYTEKNTKIISGKVEIETALKMQDELRKSYPLDEHTIHITE